MEELGGVRGTARHVHPPLLARTGPSVEENAGCHALLCRERVLGGPEREWSGGGASRQRREGRARGNGAAQLRNGAEGNCNE